jgi:hypothetical protein
MPEQLILKNPTDFHLDGTTKTTKQVKSPKRQNPNKPMKAKDFIDANKAKEVVVPAVGFITGAAASSLLNKNIAPRIANVNLQRAARVLVPIVGGMVTLSVSRKEFAKRVAYGMGITAVYEGISVLNEVMGAKIPFLSQINNTVNPAADTQVNGWVQPTMPALAPFSPAASSYKRGADVVELTTSTIEEV